MVTREGALLAGGGLPQPASGHGLPLPRRVYPGPSAPRRPMAALKPRDAVVVDEAHNPFGRDANTEARYLCVELHEVPILWWFQPFYCLFRNADFRCFRHIYVSRISMCAARSSESASAQRRCYHLSISIWCAYLSFSVSLVSMKMRLKSKKIKALCDKAFILCQRLKPHILTTNQ